MVDPESRQDIDQEAAHDLVTVGEAIIDAANGHSRPVAAGGEIVHYPPSDDVFGALLVGHTLRAIGASRLERVEQAETDA